MRLQPELIPPVAKATVQVAQIAFPKGNVYMQMKNKLRSAYTDELFAGLDPTDDQPALNYWPLALATALKFSDKRGETPSGRGRSQPY